MTLFDMHHFVLLFILSTSVCSWPVFEEDNGPGLNFALSSQSVNSSTNSSMITDHTIELSKIVNTTLGGIAFLFTSVIYFFLMRYTLALSNEIILPTRFLAQNIGAILSSAWLSERHRLGEEYEPEGYYEPPGEACKLLLKISDPPTHSGIGYCNERMPIVSLHPFPEPEILCFKTFSPVMKSLIQIAIWNGASSWILLVAITNTLVYNGFLTNNITTDGIVRLLLVGSYAVANIAHQIHFATLLYRNFSFIIFQASWTIVCNNFLVYAQSNEGSQVLMQFNLQLLGTSERSDTYDVQLNRPGHIYENLVLGDESDRGESELDKFIKPQRETELKACEKAADSALERILANVAVLIGICLAAALAPWTSLQASSSTSAQLGSYAMLLSISTGLLALVSSMGHLSNATESIRKLLEYQECAITSEFDIHNLASSYELSEHLHRPHSGFFSRRQRRPSYSFWSRQFRIRYSLRYSLTFWSHLRSIKGPRRVLGLFFGPALMLVPRLYGIRQPLNDAPKNFHFTVKGVKYLCNSVGEFRIARDTTDDPIPGVGSEAPDQAGGIATRDAAGTEAGGRSYQAANEQADG